MSEDPTPVAVWCRIRPRGGKAAAEDLLRHQPDLTLLEAKKRANRCLASATPLLLAPRVGWGEACSIRSHPPEWSSEVTVFQAGWGPEDDRVSFCALHSLWHGGCLGCHVAATITPLDGAA